jgi:hypothetical protein
MHSAPLAPREAEALKQQILQYNELSTEIIIELVPSPVYDVLNCRVQTKSTRTRRALVDHFHGISVGESVYFTVPRQRLGGTSTFQSRYESERGWFFDVCSVQGYARGRRPPLLRREASGPVYNPDAWARFLSESGGCFRSVENGFEKNCACLVEALRGLIIALSASLRIELPEGDAGFEELVGLGQ